MIELEHRWKLLNSDLCLIPKDCITSKVTIEQIYTNPNKSEPSNRIRKSWDNEVTFYQHCTKYKLEENKKEEIEIEITVNQYERIFDLVGKVPIKKERWFVSLMQEGMFAQIDIYSDGDIILEVEFRNEEEYNRFIKPSWFGEEIIERKSFSYEKFCEMNKKGVW